jgi:hypothetical protein
MYYCWELGRVVAVPVICAYCTHLISCSYALKVQVQDMRQKVNLTERNLISERHV